MIPLEYTIALGGVATGSMNAHEHPNVAPKSGGMGLTLAMPAVALTSGANRNCCCIARQFGKECSREYTLGVKPHRELAPGNCVSTLPNDVAKPVSCISPPRHRPPPNKSKVPHQCERLLASLGLFGVV